MSRIPLLAALVAAAVLAGSAAAGPFGLLRRRRRPDPARRMQEAFPKADKDGDGRLSRQELGVAAARLRRRLRDARRRFGRHIPREARERLRTMEARQDLDGDGKVSEAERTQALDRLFAHLDGDRDGGVDRAELRAFGEQLRRARAAGPPP